jgi:WS/DGAT/MGAT family acyltransferase
MMRRAQDVFGIVGGAGGVLRDPRGRIRSVLDTAWGIGEALAVGFRPASQTPLNVDIGPHRRFDWTSIDLATVKRIRSRLGGTLNDIVLAVVTGALRRFFHRRGLGVDDLDFRAMVPVNVRAEEQRGHLGNRVAMLVARLPLGEHDPQARLARVTQETGALKRSHQAQGVQTIEELSDHTFTTLFTLFARVAAASRPFNLVVTNVPGPQFQAYMLGAPMTACYPLVPLYNNQALGIALFSYNGRLWWGFNADWDALPVLHDIVAAVEAELAALRRLAGGQRGEAAA